MIADVTRVPAPMTPLQTAALRQQSANRLYRSHLLDDECRDCDRNNCMTERWLYADASAADHEHARLLVRGQGR